MEVEVTSVPPPPSTSQLQVQVALNKSLLRPLQPQQFPDFIPASLSPIAKRQQDKTRADRRAAVSAHCFERVRGLWDKCEIAAGDLSCASLI